MKSIPPHPGNRFIRASGVFDSLRFSIFAGVLGLGFSNMFCTLAVAQTASAAPPNGTRPQTHSIDSLIDEASRRFSIPALWIRSVMQVESGGDAQALSPKGAMGLMQVMPETYTALRQAYGLGADPYQPRDNIMAGTAYLREMLDLYGTSGFLAAYNAGPARYDEHRTAAGRNANLPFPARSHVVRRAGRQNFGDHEFHHLDDRPSVHRQQYDGQFWCRSR